MIIKKLASLKLAVVVLLSLAAIIAAGTIVESQYNAEIAGKLVYRTWWLYLTLALLVINLTAVMLDRWPWKKRHAPFVFAHIGIIVLIGGAFLTKLYGIDGNIRVPVNGKSNAVILPESEITVFASFDGNSFSKLYTKPVDFYLHSPKERPVMVDLADVKFLVKDYIPFAIPERRIVETAESTAGSAIRFQIFNQNVNVTEWVLQRKKDELAQFRLGPANIYLNKIPKEFSNENQIFLQPSGKKIKYAIVSKDQKYKTEFGETSEGASIKTPWMALELKILRYFPSAEEKWHFKSLEKPTALTTDAVLVEYQNKDYWLQSDDVLKFFSDKAVYIFAYAHKKLELDFHLKLIDFEIGHYQGTNKASSYKSVVEIPEELTKKGHGISMNEPLKYQDLTVYQASFEQDPNTGKPISSIFSVNYDPGRWFKYLGSLILSFGTVLLFYNKRKRSL